LDWLLGLAAGCCPSAVPGALQTDRQTSPRGARGTAAAQRGASAPHPRRGLADRCQLANVKVLAASPFTWPLFRAVR